MEMDFLKQIITSTDPVVLICIVVMYLVLSNKIQLINKDISRIDKAVNHREAGEKTMSQEVTEINTVLSKLYTKVEVQISEVKHIKEQVDAHRAEDEKIFAQMGEDIHELNKNIAVLAENKRPTKKR